MADPVTPENKNFLMRLLGRGQARKAAEETSQQKQKMDAAMKAQGADDEPAQKKDTSYDKGKDAGELGKKWSDNFHF